MPLFIALLDANVLYPAELRSFLMYLAVPGVYRAKWSKDIHEEWMSSLLINRPDLTRAQLERTRELMDKNAPDANSKPRSYLRSQEVFVRFAHNPFRNAPNTSPVGTFTSVRPRLRSYGSLGEIGAALVGPHPAAADGAAARERNQSHQQ